MCNLLSLLKLQMMHKMAIPFMGRFVPEELEKEWSV